MTAPLLSLRDDLCSEALRQGWAAAGVTDLAPFTEARRHGLDAIRAGRMDGMSWMSEERIVAATDLAPRYPWGRSLLALAWPYRTADSPGRAPGMGRMASYACLEDDAARPADYHDLLARRCDDLLGWLRQRVPDVRAKRFIDHGWAMDRAIAERAGVGFTGKHAQLLTTSAGSYVLLASLVLSVELPPHEPSRRACGTCRACLPSCPTGAIVAPGVIDARRCISYLTIEHEGPIPFELRPLMGTWVFGCDLCQEACPINHARAPAAIAPTRGRAGPAPFVDMVSLLELDDGAFATRFAGTAVLRTGRARLARNCAVALGNAGDRAAIPVLSRAANDDPDATVREAAEWALARLSAEAPSLRS